MANITKGRVSEKDEFLFPDSELEVLPEKIRIAIPKNGKRGIQILIPTTGKEVKCELTTESFIPEWYEMKDIPVEYNTGNGVEQGGGMVLMEPCEQKPPYAVKNAPFRVYDCLIPRTKAIINVKDGLAAVYVCLIPAENIKAGTHFSELSVKLEEGEYHLQIEVQVYDVDIPKGDFQITNWFSLESMCRFHNVKQGTPEFMEVLENYIDQMLRLRQTCFYINLDSSCVASTNPYLFDFSHLKPMISLFFNKGMQYLEIGPFLSREKKSDGNSDMLTDTFCCSVSPDVKLETWEGYELTVLLAKALGEFLQENGWQDKVIAHIHDEPDVHANSDEIIQARKRQYYQTASILRKYLPGISIIEAVNSSQFCGGVDIWVPITASYEKQNDDFQRFIALGEKVWTYVCCGPQGFWLNRFLDSPLIRNRLLFWGCESNSLSGFLHWGFNYFLGEMDPFISTSCPNYSGIGTDFPCGDSFIVYPGEGKEVWPSIRLEAQRRGAEDVELLKILRKINLEKHDELVGKMFISNEQYCENPSVMEAVYEELLEQLTVKPL